MAGDRVQARFQFQRMFYCFRLLHQFVHRLIIGCIRPPAFLHQLFDEGFLLVGDVILWETGFPFLFGLASDAFVCFWNDKDSFLNADEMFDIVKTWIAFLVIWRAGQNGNQIEVNNAFHESGYGKDDGTIRCLVRQQDVSVIANGM